MRRHPTAVTLAATAALVALAAVGAVGVARAQEPRLAARLDRPTRDTVQAVVEAARAQGLPVEPLLDRAFEGAEKGISPERIVAAVRNLAREMGDARAALGDDSDANEIKAGAHALHAGVPAAELSRLRSRAPRRRRLTMPIAVLTDLVALRVPAATAGELIGRLTRSSADDGDLADFQRVVHLDVRQGADPATAASTRAQGVLVRVGGSS